MCTRKETLAHILGAPRLDDVMSYNSLPTDVISQWWDLVNRGVQLLNFVRKSVKERHKKRGGRGEGSYNVPQNKLHPSKVVN